MNEVVIKNKKINIPKLTTFGFSQSETGYIYSAEIMDNQMELSVTVSEDEKIYTKLTDTGSGEEYVLHLVSSAVGSFVGQVKAEYEAILDEISAKCFDIEVFKSEQAKAVIAYVKDTYGDEPEYLWQKFPDNAVVRRKDNKKWYAALLTISKRKLGFDTDELIEILDLRMKSEDIEKRVDMKKYFPGYHMNKKHWITICFDKTVPYEEICSMIDGSYVLAAK